MGLSHLLLVIGESVYASNREIFIHQDALGFPRISGFLPHFENRPGYLQFMIRGGVVGGMRSGNVEFLVNSTHPSVVPISFWMRSPDDRFIDMRYGSYFSQTVGNMMMLPIGDGGGFRMIMSVTDIENFCVNGSLILVPLVELATHQPTISVEIALRSPIRNNLIALWSDSDAPATYTETINIGVTTEMNSIRLPISIQRALLEAIRVAGFVISGRDRIRSIAQVSCMDLIPRLPTIHISVRSSTAEHVGHIFLEGIDYIRVLDTGECRSRVYVGDIVPPPSGYFLGIPFLEQVGVLFDYANNQMGICDPPM